MSDPDPSYPYPNARLGDFGWDPQIASGGKVFSWPGGYVVPANSADVMSYCQDEWISEYTYRAILNYRGVTAAAAEAPAEHQQALPSGGSQRSEEAVQPYLFASGTINGEQVELDPWSILERPVGSSDEPGEGEYQLRLVSHSAVTWFVRSFDPEMAMPSPLPGFPASVVQDAVFSFYEVLPWHADTAHVQLWQGESLLAERTVSTHPPEVQILSPGSGDSWASDEQVTIEWLASDGDGEPLWFDVAFSRDGGATWEVFATRLDETHLDVSGDQFPGTEQAMLQVSASDGLLTSDDTAGPFSIAPKPPQAIIALPSAGATLPPGTPVPFTGYAYDREDGPLAGEVLTWESDRDGVLGNGEELLVPMLSPGTHQITLTVIDSDGQIGLAQVNIFVGHRIYLPITLKNVR